MDSQVGLVRGSAVRAGVAVWMRGSAEGRGNEAYPPALETVQSNLLEIEKESDTKGIN